MNLHFLNTTSMCPPPEKGVPKSMRSIKRSLSMWEQVDEMNMMVGSSGTWWMGFVDNWKWWSLHFVWKDLVKKWESYEDLKF